LKLLLDTHVAIWTLIAPERLPASILGLIAQPDNSVYVSAATIWEIAIKHALKRSSAPPFSARDAIAHFGDAGFLFVDVTSRHAAEVEKLPLRHGDPFDRLLVAQALSEPFRLVTHDPNVAAYSDFIIVF
jgi:PIN domain nuclease of toxin-antitoxin system